MVKISTSLIQNCVEKMEQTMQTSLPRCRQKVPRFLFHFTSAECAQKIISTGEIKASKDGGGIIFPGVFMIDFQNLVKNWTKLFWGDKGGKVNLLTCLFAQATKGKNKICCFRIPTSNLDSEIIIRSQNELTKAWEAGRGYGAFSKAKKYKLYQRNGHAIEYIHLGNVKVNETNLLDTIELPKELIDFFKDPNFNDTDFARFDDQVLKYLKELFKEQPESKIFA